MTASRICLVALLAACSGKAQTPVKESTGKVPAPTAVSRGDYGLLIELSVIATTEVPPPAVLAEWRGAIDRGTRTLDQYVEYLLARPGFARVVAPEMLFGETLFRSTANLNRLDYYKLKTTPPKDGPPIAFLTKPCKPEQAVEVEPWWALGTKIKVCPAAHKPNVWDARKGGPTCNSVEGAPTFDDKSPCGCGPNLIRCFLDESIEQTRKQEAHDELRGTVAYAIQNDKPLRSIFTGTATFRRRNLEGVYRWHKIEAQHIADPVPLFKDLKNWPEQGKWADREELAPGQHSGLVTAMANIYQQPDPRQRQWRLFDIMWCTGVASMGVSSEAMLSLKVHSLQQRNEGWQTLAKRAVCTNCHARMDYGIQFFSAYPSPVSYAGHFVPQLQTAKTGSVYLHNIDDRRGEAKRTPADFVKVVMAQPEFQSCIASEVTEHVFGVDTSGAEIASIQQLLGNKDVTIKEVVKAALLHYAAHPHLKVVEPVAGAASDGTHVPAALRAKLGELCGDCHHSKASLPDLESPTLSRSLLLSSFDYLGSTYMPKEQRIPIEDRLALGRLLIDHLWSDEAKRAEAYTWFAGALLQPTTNRWSTMHRAIDLLAGAQPGPKWNAVENGTKGDQAALTPNVGLMSTLEAIRACKSAGKKGADLETCVERATPTSLLTR